jgi:hypothetical protein
MNETRLKRLIEAYGAEPERWPAGDRAAALALLDTSAEARAMMAEARRLDQLLKAVPVGSTAPDATAALRRKIAALPDAPPRAARANGVTIGPWSAARLWASAAGLAAAGLIGFVVGMTQLPSTGDQADVGDLRELVGLTGGELQP